MSFYCVFSVLFNGKLVILLIITGLCLLVNAQKFETLGTSSNSVIGEKFVKVRTPEEAAKFSNPVFDFIGLVERHGYAAEEHTVITEDGYILKIHRILPHQTSAQSEHSRRRVVFFQHGLLASSDSWVLLGPENDLPFLLSNAGYDVWLGNVRGNTYSRAHQTLSPKTNEFWNYSWHEIGVKDLPAMIDYVLEATGSECLTYIGHSMGTTSGYILLSEKPEYNAKIKLFISLAPIAYWNIGQSARFDSYYTSFKLYHNFLSRAEEGEALPQNPKNPQLAKLICQQLIAPICAELLSFVLGSTLVSRTPADIAWILSYWPAGISVKSVEHYRQAIKTEKFQQYDYGERLNQIKYNQQTPPIYDVSKISAPVVLIYAKNDVFATEQNVLTLKERLSHVVTFEAVDDEKFSHLDFLWASNARSLLYERVLSLIEAWRDHQCIMSPISH